MRSIFYYDGKIVYLHGYQYAKGGTKDGWDSGADNTKEKLVN